MNSENVKGKAEPTLDDFVAKVKETSAYDIFKVAVEKVPDKDHRVLLEVPIMLQSLIDEKFQKMMMDVSFDLLFELVSQKLSNEILGDRR